MPDEPVKAGALLLAILPHALVVSAIGGGIWWIDHNAADRTRQQIETERVKAENTLREELRRSEGRLADAFRLIGEEVHSQIGALGARHETVIRPTLIKELTRETRFTDPAAGISDGVREELNAALSAVTCTPRAAGGISCALPDALAPAEQRHRRTDP